MPTGLGKTKVHLFVQLPHTTDTGYILPVTDDFLEKVPIFTEEVLDLIKKYRGTLKDGSINFKLTLNDKGKRVGISPEDLEYLLIKIRKIIKTPLYSSFRKGGLLYEVPENKFTTYDFLM